MTTSIPYHAVRVEVEGKSVRVTGLRKTQRGTQYAHRFLEGQTETQDPAEVKVLVAKMISQLETPLGVA